MKISAVIPTHNRSGLLRGAIESVLNQEPCGAAIDIIVVDDDSSDDTADVVASYPSVRYVRTRQGTAAGSRNVGIGYAEGEWIAFLDDDDVWLPHKLCRCRTIMAENTRAQFIFSAATICNSQLRPTGTWTGPHLKDGTRRYEAFLTEVMTPSVVVVRADIFARVGLFDPSVPRAEDRDMWLRIVAAGVECAGTDEALVLYREREQPDGEMLYQTFGTTMRVLQRHMMPHNTLRPSWSRRQRVLWRTRGWYAHQILCAARHAGRAGQRPSARRLRRLAFGISPIHAAKAWLAVEPPVETS